jgi:ethanolamine permease
LALAQLVGNNNLLYHALITVGLFGLVASFHGLMLASGRSTFEFGKVIVPNSMVGKVHSKFQTPANALLFNMMVGILALLTGKTSEIITISVFGALTLYFISMISLLKLRTSEPRLERPFQVPFYPVFPLLALLISFVSLVAMTIFNLRLAILYFLIIALSFGIYKVTKRKLR